MARAAPGDGMLTALALLAFRVTRIEGILRVIGADALEPERVRRAEASIGRLRAQLAELQAGEGRLAEQASPLPAAHRPREPAMERFVYP